MIQEDIIKLVLVRLQSMPENIEVNFGSFGTLNKSELIDHVKKQDELGQQIVDMQMAYLRSLKTI